MLACPQNGQCLQENQLRLLEAVCNPASQKNDLNTPYQPLQGLKTPELWLEMCSWDGQTKHICQQTDCNMVQQASGMADLVCFKRTAKLLIMIAAGGCCTRCKQAPKFFSCCRSLTYLQQSAARDNHLVHVDLQRATAHVNTSTSVQCCTSLPIA